MKHPKTMYWWADFDGLDLGFFRIGGPGLGNLLFPFSRALIGSARSGGHLVTPTWPQLKLGPLLRGEKDLRFYGGIFRQAPLDVSVLRGLLLRQRLPIVDEGTDHSSSAYIRRVSGMAGQFSELLDHRTAFLSEFCSRLSQESYDILQARKRHTIAIHIRLGDFSAPHSTTEANRTTNTSTPTAWYVAVIRQIRSYDRRLIFELHSDGTDLELSPLLSEDGVYRIDNLNAMDAILSMSACSGLIASGSTFSRWACFIGGIPTLYYPGQMGSAIFRGQLFERESFAPLDVDDIRGIVR